MDSACSVLSKRIESNKARMEELKKWAEEKKRDFNVCLEGIAKLEKENKALEDAVKKLESCSLREAFPH